MNTETAQELRQSILWTEILKELDTRIIYLMSKLRSCSPEQLVEIQASIRCFEALKNLPQDVIDRESQ